MAHCTSSLVHKSSFLAHQSTHNEKPQDLLPPRKRLLASFKQVKASQTSSTPPPPPPSQSVQIEVHVDPTHTSTPPPYSLLLCSLTETCSSCGDVGVLLHRVPSLGGNSSYHCSSCVLATNKNMYCLLCYQVISEEFTSFFSSSSSSSASSGLLTCCRCQRYTHLECALKIWSPAFEGAGLTLCRDCNARNNGQFREPPSKKQKTGSAQQFKQAVVTPSNVKLPSVDIQALAAAQIVAMVAKRGALEAKQRARVLAQAAACAAMHAKTALDNVHRLSQKETFVEGDLDTSVRITQKEEGVAMAAPKTPKNLKKRALSAIVASEMLLKQASSMKHHVSLTVYPDSKQMRTSLDADCAQVMPAHNYMAEGASHCQTQRARLAAKRRKTLSSIGMQHPPSNARKVAILKGSKLASRRKINSYPSSKGNLGAIVSQVLASNKFLKNSGKAASKVNSSGLQCATENGAKKNTWSMNVMAMKVGFGSK